MFSPGGVACALAHAVLFATGTVSTVGDAASVELHLHRIARKKKKGKEEKKKERKKEQKKPGTRGKSNSGRREKTERQGHLVGEGDGLAEAQLLASVVRLKSTILNENQKETKIIKRGKRSLFVPLFLFFLSLYLYLFLSLAFHRHYLFAVVANEQ
jgi:hypothetical protein